MARLRLLVLLLVFGCAALGFGCTPQGDPGVPSTGLKDDFERTSLGELWHNTGGPYRIREGVLHVRGARNKPLWLRRTLPRDVRIELDMQTDSPEGDIKFEVFGDGASKATRASYTATSYVIIFGGWNNSKNLIARMDEHGKNVGRGPTQKIEPGKRYHVRLERRGGELTVWLDDKKFMHFNDPEPLSGRGHDHFAFNNWESDLSFDNLSIEAL